MLSKEGTLSFGKRKRRTKLSPHALRKEPDEPKIYDFTRIITGPSHH